VQSQSLLHNHSKDAPSKWYSLPIWSVPIFRDVEPVTEPTKSSRAALTQEGENGTGGRERREMRNELTSERDRGSAVRSEAKQRRELRNERRREWRAPTRTQE